MLCKLFYLFILHLYLIKLSKEFSLHNNKSFKHNNFRTRNEDN